MLTCRACQRLTGHWVLSRSLGLPQGYVLDVPLVADLLAIRDKRQLAVDVNLRRINAKRTSYDLSTGTEGA